PPRAAMNFRLAILIATGPSSGGRAHWVTANDSTSRLAGLCPTSRGPMGGEALTVFLRCEVTRVALNVVRCDAAQRLMVGDNPNYQGHARNDADDEGDIRPDRRLRRLAAQSQSDRL